ncbi:MAG: sugar kinase [Parafilimonas sp.]|nr:sugar kinase [Parafilimonas sp.]
MVLSFGEILLRIAPDAEGEWLQKNVFEVYPGGSELNVAAALAKWKVPVCYCTAAPENFLSAQLIKNIETLNIDTSTIIYSGNKIGLYYLLQGKEIQHAEVIYDRAHSSFYELKPGMINWDAVLQGIRWFHFSAISPALNEDVAAVCKEALEVCAKKSITVSVDLNYRPKLWQYGKPPNTIMPGLLKYCDIVMGNVWSMETMLDIPVQKNIDQINTKENYVWQARKTSEEILKKFPRCQIVANTFRFHKTDIEYYATIFSGNNLYVSASYHADEVIDKVGSGDCFMAGLIYGVYNHLPFQQVINFATGAAFQKLFVKGDCTDKTVNEIKSFVQHHHG